jgi:hypothetical protein
MGVDIAGNALAISSVFYEGRAAAYAPPDFLAVPTSALLVCRGRHPRVVLRGVEVFPLVSGTDAGVF